MTSEKHPPISIARPCLGEEEWQALRAPIDSGWLTQGPQVAAFESAFAARQQVPHAIAVSSCTTGLHLILAALGIGPGDEVIVPAFTWVATANVVLHTGARPVFADVDPLTFNIDPADAARRVTARTRALIAVHLFGLCADMDRLRACMPRPVNLIEDAACAIGAMYRGRPAGTLGVAAAFSLHPRKIITTGEGGLITTADDDLAATMRMLRNHGAAVSEEERCQGPQPWLLPEFNLLGYNYRLTDLQGAIGRVQLGRLEGLLLERRRGAEYYRQNLADLPWLHLPTASADHTPTWQAFVTRVDAATAPFSRNTIMARLHQAGIATRPGTHAVHTLTYYRQRFGLRPEDCPQAAACQNDTLTLPLHSGMTPNDYARVVAALREL